MFEPLRAVGLALEKGLKLARAKGLGQVSASDLETVAVGGSLQVLQEGVWQPQKRTLLALRGQDSELSSALLQEVRSYLHQKGFCPSEVDLKVPGMRCHLDLLGDCISSSPLFVKGKLWVELMFAPKRQLVGTLPRLQSSWQPCCPRCSRRCLKWKQCSLCAQWSRRMESTGDTQPLCPSCWARMGGKKCLVELVSAGDAFPCPSTFAASGRRWNGLHIPVAVVPKLACSKAFLNT